MYKSLFSSVTFWGVVISFLAKIALAFGVFELDEGLQTDIANSLATYAPLAIGFVGDAISLWGRVNATKPIKTNLLTTTKTKQKRKAAARTGAPTL